MKRNIEKIETFHAEEKSIQYSNHENKAPFPTRMRCIFQFYFRVAAMRDLNLIFKRKFKRTPGFKGKPAKNNILNLSHWLYMNSTKLLSTNSINRNSIMRVHHHFTYQEMSHNILIKIENTEN